MRTIMSFVVSMLLVFSVTTIGSAAIDQGASTTNSSNGAAFLANAPSPPNNTVAVPVSALHTNNSAALVPILSRGQRFDRTPPDETDETGDIGESRSTRHRRRGHTEFQAIHSDAPT